MVSVSVVVMMAVRMLVTNAWRMEWNMMTRPVMVMIRLMVDFGPFFVDSATRKCGLKDHGVDFETWS